MKMFKSCENCIYNKDYLSCAKKNLKVELTTFGAVIICEKAKDRETRGNEVNNNNRL